MCHGIEREVEVDKQKREWLRLEDSAKSHVTGCSLRGKIVPSLTTRRKGGRGRGKPGLMYFFSR